ncbi:hypothetical protein CJ20_247 [Escherichia phage CJ20]|nr:hypothetical protein CJ20_247 [Escherichia phage CJ20]
MVRACYYFNFPFISLAICLCGDKCNSSNNKNRDIRPNLVYHANLSLSIRANVSCIKIRTIHSHRLTLARRPLQQHRRLLERSWLLSGRNDRRPLIQPVYPK